MDLKAISINLNRSSTYLRKKSFLYPISKDDDKTLTPSVNMMKGPSVREAETSPSPAKKNLPSRINGSNIQKVPTIKLRQSLTQLSLQNIQNRHFSLNEDSPCRTEIPTYLNYKPMNSFSSRGNFSPISSKLNTQRLENFSKVSERYEDHHSGHNLDGGDSLNALAKSSIHFKENSFEISEIIEENSLSEQNIALAASPILPSDSGLSSESSSPRPLGPIMKDFSFENIPVEQNSCISLPSSNMLLGDLVDYKQKARDKSLDHSSLNPKEINTNFMSMTFEEALANFKSLKLEYLHDDLWLTTWVQKLCCILPQDLDDETNEICERLIIFAYSGYNQDNIFHSRLLVSIYEILISYSSKQKSWTGIGFSSNNPYETDLNHDMAALGMLQLLFINKYLPDSLSEVLCYCLENSMSFMLIAFDITEICITVLRKKILNHIISDTNKVLEVIFFMYAGCLLYWINLHKSNQQIPAEINILVEQMAKKQPKVLINLASEQFNIQADRI